PFGEGQSATVPLAVTRTQPGRTVVDPGVLARRAEGLLRLPAPTIHLAPGPPLWDYVGLETWLWIPQDQWHEPTRSVTAGRTTVTVHARPIRVAWDMGPGSTTCAGPGRVWRKWMSDAATTSCSYTYDQTSYPAANHQFDVSAVLVYGVDWACTGA